MKVLITFLNPPAPQPAQLWEMAGGDTPRYLQLMREHGFIVPGPAQPLPCGAGGHRVSLDSTMLTFRIASQSGNGFYLVRQLPDGRWYCPCPDFEYRGHERPCKHVVIAKQLADAATQSQDGRGKVMV
jgi:hypothetical protein